jgi:hypothetical protein
MKTRENLLTSRLSRYEFHPKISRLRRADRAICYLLTPIGYSALSRFNPVAL